MSDNKNYWETIVFHQLHGTFQCFFFPVALKSRITPKIPSLL